MRREIEASDAIRSFHRSYIDTGDVRVAGLLDLHAEGAPRSADGASTAIRVKEGVLYMASAFVDAAVPDQTRRGIQYHHAVLFHSDVDEDECLDHGNRLLTRQYPEGIAAFASELYANLMDIEEAVFKERVDERLLGRTLVEFESGPPKPEKPNDQEEKSDGGLRRSVPATREEDPTSGGEPVVAERGDRPGATPTEGASKSVWEQILAPLFVNVAGAIIVSCITVAAALIAGGAEDAKKSADKVLLAVVEAGEKAEAARKEATAASQKAENAQSQAAVARRAVGSALDEAVSAKEQAQVAKTKADRAATNAQTAVASAKETLQDLTRLREALSQVVTPIAIFSLEFPPNDGKPRVYQQSNWRRVSELTLVTASFSFPNDDGDAVFRFMFRNPEGSVLDGPHLAGSPENPYPAVSFMVPPGWQYASSANLAKPPRSRTVSIQILEAKFRFQ